MSGVAQREQFRRMALRWYLKHLDRDNKRTETVFNSKFNYLI